MPLVQQVRGSRAVHWSPAQAHAHHDDREAACFAVMRPWRDEDFQRRPFARSKAEAIRTLTSFVAMLASLGSLLILVVVHLL